MPDQHSHQEADDSSTLDSEDADHEPSGTNSSPAASAMDPTSDDGDPDAAEGTETPDDLEFEDDELGEKLRHTSEEKLDRAPFGIIRVDDDGLVEFFNQYESELSGMEPEEVRGRNFFTQVAPCTNNRLFRGRFKKGVRRGELDETFTYTYTYKMRPTLVDVHLYRDEAGQNWITVQKY